jgi:hypothetical protein
MGRRRFAADSGESWGRLGSGIALPTCCIEGTRGGGDRDRGCAVPRGRRIGGRVFCSLYEGGNFGDVTVL